MHETQQHAQPPSRGSTAAHARKGRRFSRKAIAAVLAAAVALVAVPAIAIANSFTVDYSWYKNATGSTYVIKTPGQWNAFANLVNGSADEGEAGTAVDSFKGKTVELSGDLNFFGQDALPVGGQGGRTFDGAFDGKDHEIVNVKIDAQGATANVGLIGAAGEGSSISNVKINKTVSLTIAATDNTKAIENVGVLVGSSKGSISNASSAGTLTVSHTMDQTRDIVFPIKNVGGVAGICTGDVTGVSNAGAVSVSEPGVPYKADSADSTWEDQSILAINIGGIVGSAGDVDSTVDKAAGTAHGTISNCSNTGSVKVDTPKTNGLDRFGNTVYSQSSNVGGIAGYSRGFIDTCTNSGYLDAPHASGMGGIVGGLRAKTTTTSYSGNFTQEGSDDGMAAGADALAVANCTNSGSVYGYSFPAGIVGRAGTYTRISGCINDSAATILGSRATKPFPAGIVGGSYGTVSYCGNLGTIVAGTWTGEGGAITQSGGYFASGIAGNLSCFTKDVDGEQQNASGTPEVYGCYNAGAVKAIDNMRQRALVGDNGGYVHDNVAVAGLVYNDRLVYGMYADDTEMSGGTVYNNVLLSADDFKANNAYDPAKQDSVSRCNPNTTNAIAVLNVNADKDGWGTYWTKSNGSANGGNPALNSQVNWPATDLSAATVEFAANAQYTGLAATPKATVTLNGKQLQQDTDFRVVPQEGAIEVTAADSKPYTAKVQGIGAYSGEAGSFAYGIDKGDLANCTVTFDTKVFNWTAQEPAATGVHVKNTAGKEIASSEYTFAFDQSDKNLSNIDASGNATTEDTGKKGAVNAKKYAMVVTAAADSAHFTGKADGTFAIKTAKIAWDKDAEKLKQNAYPTSVSYDGSIISFPKENDTADNIAWDSMTLRADLSPEQQDDGLLTVSYTGKSIKPAVNDVVYKGKSLTPGVDYRVVYGASLNEGQVVEAGKENLGKAGGEDFGYVTARYISGGNFSNYDNMKFKIVDQGAKLDIADAQVKGTDDIVFEQGGVYTPITVWYGGSQLTEGSDYSIAYTDNDKLGTASFQIEGVGAYTGKKSGTFNLVEGTPYELRYAFNADGTATVTGVEYNGALDAFDLTIPETVEHDGKAYTVTAIGNKAFGGLASDFSGSKANESKGKIASVTVPATVKSLGAYAFGASTTGDASMAQLKSITFAEGSQLETIGNFAFAKTGISEIVIPAGVKTIGQNAFSGDNGVLKSVTFMSESGSMPEFAAAVASKGSFYGVNGVTAKAYDGTAAAAFAQNMVKSNSWKFVSMGKVLEKAAFTVSFDALGGMPVPEAQTVDKGAAAAKPATDPAKADSTFVGWFESSDGGKTLADSAYDFATPVTADKVLYAKWEEAAEGALVVKVQDADGTVIETKSVSASDLQAMATTDGEPAIGQYAKGGKWNVYRSTNYVTYNDLFANLGLSVGAYDVVKACAADGSGKWSGTLGTMNSGAWYPNAESQGSTVNLGAAAQTLPAGLALSYTTGAGATPAAALAAAESGDAKLDMSKAPLQLMGVCDNTVGGNRFWSNVATIEVTRNAATALTVETQDAEGNVIASKDASYADLLSWKSDGEARGQYYKGGKWNVYRSTDYVTFDDLIANLGLNVSGSDKLFFDKASPKAWSGTLDAANAGKWYPDAESDSALGEADGMLPAGVMLAYAKGSGDTVSEALEATQEMGSGSGIVSIMGAWDGTTGGNRFWSGLTKLVFQQQISIAEVKGGEGSFGYKQGDIAATVDAKLMSDLTDASYQWYSVDAAARARVAGTPIEGATSATYELPAGKPAGTYTVYCVVSAKDAKGEAISATTDPVDLVVDKAPNSIAWVGEGFDASSNSVTVTAQAKPGTAADGETAAAVQYAISSSASADASALAWQDSASFAGLDADTAYYVYAKVSGLPNYADAVSEPLNVRTKAVGKLASPVLDAVTYDPTATLAGIKLPSGWKWADGSTVPTVKCGAYDAVFAPTAEQLASTDYSKVDGWDSATKTVRRTVALTVNKATPVIAAAPSATDLVFGQTLGESSLAGGTASAAGTFAWDEPQRMPQVSESGVACMTVHFAPADADNYNAASVKIAVKVAPKNLAKDAVTITVPGQIYTGAALEPALIVVYNGVTLAAGVDYDVAYANNVEVGTAGYTVTFKGNYAGTASGTFAIAKAPAASVPSDQVTGPTGPTGAAAAPQASAAPAVGAAPAAGNATALVPTGDGVLGGIVAAVCAIVVAAIVAAFARRRMSR